MKCYIILIIDYALCVIHSYEIAEMPHGTDEKK